MKLIFYLYYLFSVTEFCDYILEHPSISRLHAAIQLRGEDQSIMLVDLQSAQGTFINKKKCDPHTYYRVLVGDIVTFGASTRKYIMNGPSDQQPAEYNSTGMVQYRAALQARTKAAEEKLHEGASWGFRCIPYHAHIHTHTHTVNHTQRETHTDTH